MIFIFQKPARTHMQNSSQLPHGSSPFSQSCLLRLYFAFAWSPSRRTESTMCMIYKLRSKTGKKAAYSIKMLSRKPLFMWKSTDLIICFYVLNRLEEKGVRSSRSMSSDAQALSDTDTTAEYAEGQSGDSKEKENSPLMVVTADVEWNTNTSARIHSSSQKTVIKTHVCVRE